eukprot:scaffold3733_cov77-Skeletonema_dohrnii-CCMP3373.AAC.1
MHDAYLLLRVILLLVCRTLLPLECLLVLLRSGNNNMAKEVGEAGGIGVSVASGKVGEIDMSSC